MIIIFFIKYQFGAVSTDPESALSVLSLYFPETPVFIF